MYYRNGWEFEHAVWRQHSRGKPPRYDDNEFVFGRHMRQLIVETRQCCPDTKIGNSLYTQTQKQLSRVGIDPTGLMLVSSIGTISDHVYQTDGFFYLPSVDPYVVTIDTFYCQPDILARLRDSWLDSFQGKVYGNLAFQSDLFRQKHGLKKYIEDFVQKYKKMPNLDDLSRRVVDFRGLTEKLRPESHFVLTPHHTERYGGRRSFSKMVAGYFRRVHCQKMANAAP